MVLQHNGCEPMTKFSKTIAGLSIQPYGVTMILLVEQSDTVKVGAIANHPLLAETIDQGVWRDLGAIQAAVGNCKEAIGRSINSVVLSLADDSVVTAKLAVPQAPFAHQQDALIKAMAVEISPWPVAETVVDWGFGGDGEDGEHRHVSLAMCNAQLIANARRVLAQLSLRLVAVEPESQSHWHLLHRLAQPPSSAAPTLTCVMAEPKRVGISTFLHGGLSASHNITPEAAATVYTPQTVLQAVSAVLRQTERPLNSNHVVLLGGSLANADLCAAMRSQLECTVVALNSALHGAGLLVDSEPSVFATVPDGAVALGCALGRFDA